MVFLSQREVWASAMATLSPERLVQLISALLSKQGSTMVAEVERRIACGEGLHVKGIQVDSNILLEALERHSARNKPVQPEDGPSEKEEPRVSARWCPAGSSRWTPGQASASLLTSKAISECEQAEPFAASISFEAPLPVFQRPDMLEKPLEYLAAGQKDVVARFLSRREGRVYLRLKAETGWVSTRSCEDLTITALTSSQALEPLKFSSWPLKSAAIQALPLVESSEADVVGPPALGQEDDGKDEADGGEGEEEEDGEVEDEEVELEVAQKAKRRPVRQFRILCGRTPILKKPGFMSLSQNGQSTLQKGETFWANGVFWAKSEQRAYLRTSAGWICERSKNDLWRLAVVRSRPRPSKKMARAVAFRGGDTQGVIKLTKDDLTKNSKGRIVSKRASEAAKKRVMSNQGFSKWTEAVKRARAELKVEGFAVVKKGTQLYEKAQSYFKA